MRKFIISDIHGVGNVYDSIMTYLDNICLTEEIELYVNGDVIDRGTDSARILLDLKRRIEENKQKIVYLGGNHELMMYKAFKKRKRNILAFGYKEWYCNGGRITDDGLDLLLNDDNKKLEIADFVGNLKIYHKFEEKIGGKNILLVHAASPAGIKDECPLCIKDSNIPVYFSVWTREDRTIPPFINLIGNSNYFTIVGHASNDNKYGFVYHQKYNYLNIDGGCARYACGLLNCDHVPLIEIKDNYLQILTFNNSNEIIYGNYFDGIARVPLASKELASERKVLRRNN